MKAKNIFRISLFAVLLCMMTIFGAMADELDAKIIRWDGTGNVEIASYRFKNNYLEATEVDGILRLSGTAIPEDVTLDKDTFLYLDIDAKDYVDIYTYPYYVIKYKTNDVIATTNFSDAKTQTFFSVVKDGVAKDHAYYFNAPCKPDEYNLTDMWRTYLLHFGTDQSDVTTKVEALSTDNYGENTYMKNLRISPIRDLDSADDFSKAVMDIEYIGFFKTKEDAEEYSARPYVAIRFDNDENRTPVKISESQATGTHVITDDGTFKLTMTATGITSTNTAVGQPIFTLRTPFSIKKYPYVAIKIKGNNTITNIPFYSLQFSDKTYLYQSLNSIESDDFITQRYYAYNMNGDGKKISTDSNETVSAPFIQFKGYNGDVNATAEIEYIAYFRDEGEMQAYDSGIAEKVNAAYKKIANADLQLQIETNSEDEIKDYVESQIATLLDADSGVTCTADVTYTAYDDVATAVVTVSADYDYTGLDGQPHTYTESKKIGITVDVDYYYDVKVIRWDESGNPVVNSDEKTYSIKKTMPAGTAYTNASTWQPEFELGGNSFALADYPYVSVKFKTNYPATIQFYAAKDDSHPDKYRYFVLSGGNNADSNWHVVGNEFTDVDDAITVSKPFFQFKNLTQTPDGDLFAEIDSISFFKSEADAQHYAFDESKVIVNGADLYAAVSSSNSASLNDDGSLRLKTTNNSLSQFRIKDVFKDAEGNNLDLYEYPYVKIRFKSDYRGNIQAYILSDDSKYQYWWYTPIGSNGANTDGKWYEALMSFNYKDGAASTSTSYNGKTWTVGTPDKSVTRIGNFPTSSWSVGGYMFHINGGSADGCLDIDYIAFYKTKEAAMSDTTYVDDKAVVEKALDDIKDLTYSYTLHQAIGETTIENYVRKTVEEKVENVNVAANANGFTYGDETCNVKVTLSHGAAVQYKTVTVNFSYLKAITLESLGAQIRPIGTEGLKADLRFGAKVEYDESDYSDVTYGMVVSPVVTDNNERKFEKISTGANYNAGSKKGADGKYLNALIVEAAKAYDIDGESYKIFTAVVTGIPDGTNGVNAYDTKIVARPYITYKVDGIEYTVYGTEMVRSVNEVKEAAGIDTEVTKDATWLND